MKLLKMLLVMCFFLLPAPVLPSQRPAIEGQHKSLKAISRNYQLSHAPRTVWERMQDPRGWWQNRLVKPNLPVQKRFVSAAQSFGEAAITNPIFFIPPTFSSGGRLAHDIEVGDFNGDGKPDLLVSNDCVSDADCSQGTVAVLLGNGDGTYQPALVSNTGAVLTSVAVGDFNRDGKLDVAVGNACPDIGCATGSVNILLGNGDGSFRTPVAYSTAGNTFSVEAGDINGDGKLDVIVANGSNSAGVLLGNGDGTFKTVSTFTTSTSGNSALFLGDFNRDGRLDLAVVTGVCGSTDCDTVISVLLGNANGTFQASGGNESFTGVNPQAVALGDANTDGRLDVAVVENCAPTSDTCVNEFVDVSLGRGDGTFSGAKSSALGSNNVTFVGFAELNGDGKPDLGVVDEISGLATVLLGAGNGEFNFLASFETEGTFPLFGAFGDFNGDGKTDFAIANECNDNQGNCDGRVLVLLGEGHGFFAGPLSFPTGGASSVDFPVSATADFNHDGTPDIALGLRCVNSDCSKDAVGVMLSNAKHVFQPAVNYDPGGFRPSAVASGDFNGDGKPDLVVINECASNTDCSQGGIGVLLGKGNGTFQPTVSYLSGGPESQSVAVGDFNHDGKLDLAVAQCADSNGCFEGSNGIVSILLGNGDGGFRSAVSYSSGGLLPEAVLGGDFNGDGKLDLAVANSNCLTVELDIVCRTGSVSVLLGNGNGTFQAAVHYSTLDDHAFTVATGDFNGDGKLDLAVGNANCPGFSPLDACDSGSIAVLLGRGNGTFGAAVTYPGGDPWPVDPADTRSSSMATADFNGDGKLDLALSNRNVLLGNGDGTFEPAQSYNPAGDKGVSEVVADFDRDGKPDLAVTTSQSLTILLNIAAGFHHSTSTAVASSMNPINLHQTVTFTATVTSTTDGMPGGSITFSDGGHALASVSIANYKAKFSTSALDAGVHNIAARYSGDETFLPSKSPGLKQAVRADTLVRLTSSRNPSTTGQSVTFIAVVVPSAGGVPIGAITFKDSSNVLATVRLSGGRAAFTTSRLRKGQHTIQAEYGGSSIDHSSATTIVQKVQ